MTSDAIPTPDATEDEEEEVKIRRLTITIMRERSITSAPNPAASGWRLGYHTLILYLVYNTEGGEEEEEEGNAALPPLCIALAEGEESESEGRDQLNHV